MATSDFWAINDQAELGKQTNHLAQWTMQTLGPNGAEKSTRCNFRLKFQFAIQLNTLKTDVLPFRPPLKCFQEKFCSRKTHSFSATAWDTIDKRYCLL